MFQLEEKIWFWALLVVPVIIVLFIMLQLWKRSAQNKFANQDIIKRLSPNRSVFKSVLKIAVLCLAFASLEPK